MVMFCITSLCRKQRKLSRLGTNFCLGCLSARNLGERERERESDTVSRRDNTQNDIRIDSYLISNKEYNNINLLNEYLIDNLNNEKL